MPRAWSFAGGFASPILELLRRRARICDVWSGVNSSGASCLSVADVEGCFASLHLAVSAGSGKRNARRGQRRLSSMLICSRAYASRTDHYLIRNPLETWKGAARCWRRDRFRAPRQLMDQRLAEHARSNTCPHAMRRERRCRNAHACPCQTIVTRWPATPKSWHSTTTSKRGFAGCRPVSYGALGAGRLHTRMCRREKV